MAEAFVLDNHQELTRLGEQRARRANEERRISDMRESLSDFGVEIENEEIRSLNVDKPDHPSFPVFIFSLALIKDVLDIFSLGWIGILANIIIVPILWFWVFGKMSFIKKRIWRRFLVYIFIEFIPFISVVPVWSFFVVRSHLTEYDQVENVLEHFERFM